MAKKLNFTTLKEMQTKKLMYSILYLLGALVLIAIGAMAAGKGGGAAIGFGLLIVAGGSWLGYTGYNMITDTKNAKACDPAYWNEYTCTDNPVGTDGDYDLDITLCEAQKNAQHAGLFGQKYAGVWLVANTVNTSNVNAFYIPADKETIEAKTGTGRIFARKAKANGDDDKGLVITGSNTGCAAAKSLGTIIASSPSATGVTLKLSGVTGLADADRITLTITSNASPPPSASSPIVASETVATLKSAAGYIISNQTMPAGSYKVTASFTGVTSVSANFTV